MSGAGLDDIAAMLRELADAGWKPLVYFGGVDWVAYPMAEVRAFVVCKGSDPLTVTRSLYRHALEHPNVPPRPPAPEPPASPLAPYAEPRAPYSPPPPLTRPGDDVAGSPRPVTPVAVAPGAIAHVAHREPGLIAALGALARAATAALRNSAPQEVR